MANTTANNLGILMVLFVLSVRLGFAEEPDRISGSVVVDAEIPGGNILLEKIDGDAVYVRQDLRDTAGDWFYWHFRVRGASGRTLTFKFTKGNVLGVRGPAISPDGGKTWSWLGATAVQSNSFSYRFPPDANDVRFSFTIPYLESHLKEFLQKHEESPVLKVGTLCRTTKGREVEMLSVGHLNSEPDYRLLLTARHHCCEAMANYVMEGILDTVLGPHEDGPGFDNTSSSWRFLLWIKMASKTATKGKTGGRTTITVTMSRHCIHPSRR